MKGKAVFFAYIPKLIILFIGCLAFIWCLTLWGCVGATRLPVREHGPTGEQLQKTELDLGFLDFPGIGRDDVASKLSHVDTGARDPRLFWGRWAESKWGYWWVMAYQGPGGGDARRMWHVKNLLVTFDDKGAIESKQVIENERLLWQQLHEAVAKEPAGNSSETIILTPPGKGETISLTASGLQILKKKGYVTVEASKIVRFSHAGSSDKRQGTGSTCHAIHFSEKTAAGEKISFCDSNAHLLEVFQYLNQRAPATMRWE